MKLSQFDYDLPKELIAQTPIKQRDHSKLLVLDKETGTIEDKKFYDIINYLGENDVLVLNKTRVIKARLLGKIQNISENKLIPCEIFLHKQINENSWDCLVYPGKKLKIGTKVYFEKLTGTIKEISDSGRIVEFDKAGNEFIEIIDKIGQIPTPPYIKEKLEEDDRYQTIYSKECGSVAAPTAGLHFTDELIDKIKAKGVKIEYVLLHIGLGTFKGIETENILDHKMHSEYITIDEETCKRLNKYKKEGKTIISVGTTSTRTLESFSEENGELRYGEKETCLFIYPGYKWKFVDKLITNFHLPKSSLIILVSSLAGEENIKKAYKHAVDSKYRFFSFGDAMFIK
ncbi:MAG: tRNA preQ1(34) S-adenosylmethionine ribosyltransferase-isomerase QueA [Candidatus Gracilibacteria bacterium]|nr:tRNA preQ1(34) S-adenosylmethionine ribosyltransferase-isomerase QueA [Candidatus Gracilibacteria bacterium]